MINPLRVLSTYTIEFGLIAGLGSPGNAHYSQGRPLRGAKYQPEYGRFKAYVVLHANQPPTTTCTVFSTTCLLGSAVFVRPGLLLLPLLLGLLLFLFLRLRCSCCVCCCSRSCAYWYSCCNSCSSCYACCCSWCFSCWFWCYWCCYFRSRSCCSCCSCWVPSFCCCCCFSCCFCSCSYYLSSCC